MVIVAILAAFICGYMLGHVRQYARGKAETERALSRMYRHFTA